MERSPKGLNMLIGYIGKKELNSAKSSSKFIVSRKKTKAKFIDVYAENKMHITEDEIKFLAKMTGMDKVLKMSDYGMLIVFCENVLRLDRGG